MRKLRAQPLADSCRVPVSDVPWYLLVPAYLSLYAVQLMRISVVHLLIRGAILPPARGVLRPLARKASRGGARRVPRPQGTVEEQWGVAGWNASSCDAFRRVLEHGERGRLGKAPGLCEAAREAPDCGTERLLRDGKCASVRELIGPAPPSSCSDDAACNDGGTCSHRFGRCDCHVDVDGTIRGRRNCSSSHTVGLPATSARLAAGFGRHYADLTRITADGEGAVGSARGSGGGSTLLNTLGIRVALPHLVELLDIGSIADMPCGDWNWMRTIVNATEMLRIHAYYGGDVVPALVRALRAAFAFRDNANGNARVVDFLNFDLLSHPLFPVDLLVVRDILFHFPTHKGLNVLQNAQRSGSKYLLSTYFPNFDNSKRRVIAAPGYKSFAPLDLEAPPYNLGPPLLALGFDGPPPGAAGAWTGKIGQRVMGLWRFPLRNEALN